MKKLCVLCLFVAFSASSALADESVVKDGVKSIVSGVVSVGKDAITGVTEGIDSGRREGESADKAKLVASKEDFAKLLSVTVVKSENMGSDKYRLTLAVKNDNEFPVRITNLSEAKNLVVIDKDGFSSPLDNPVVQGQDLTALPKSLTRARYVFSGVEAEPAMLRIFEAEMPVPASVSFSAKE